VWKLKNVFNKQPLEIVREHLGKHMFLSVVIFFIVSTGFALSSGYWIGILSVPQEYCETIYVSENLWCERIDVVRDDVNAQWNIFLVLDNLGRENLTVTMVLLNRHEIYENSLNRSPSVFGNNATVTPMPPLTFAGLSGTYEKVNLDSKTMIVTLKYGTLGFVSGYTVEIYFHTETGMDYLISVTLP